MPSAAYFRRQADVCLRLSLIASDNAVSTRLLAMAKDYMATSETLGANEAPGPGTPAPPIDPAASSEPASVPASFDKTPQAADSQGGPTEFC
jgi:hypothetical protein